MVLGEAGGSDAASGCPAQAGLQRERLSLSPEGWVSSQDDSQYLCVVDQRNARKRMTNTCVTMFLYELNSSGKMSRWGYVVCEGVKGAPHDQAFVPWEFIPYMLVLSYLFV